MDLKSLSITASIIVACLLAFFGFLLEIWETDLGLWWTLAMLLFFVVGALISRIDLEDDWEKSEKNDGGFRFPEGGNSQPLTEKKNKLRCSYCDSETTEVCNWSGCKNGICQRCKASGIAEQHYKVIGKKKSWHGQSARVDYVRSGHRCKKCSERNTGML